MGYVHLSCVEGMVSTMSSLMSGAPEEACGAVNIACTSEVKSSQFKSIQVNSSQFKSIQSQVMSSHVTIAGTKRQIQSEGINY
jgi:hypothetical protein